MTSVLMLARLRTLLDEATASFWSDTECYTALSDGQREVVNSVKNPQILKVLLKTATGSNTSGTGITLPTDFREFVNAKWTSVTAGTQYPCSIINYNEQFLRDKDNTYLAPIRLNPVVYLNAITGLRLIYFEPASANGDYTIVYLKQPTEITAGVDSILSEETHEAIILYAFSFLLRKDLRQAEADGAYKLFLEMVGKL